MATSMGYDDEEVRDKESSVPIGRSLVPARLTPVRELAMSSIDKLLIQGTLTSARVMET